MEWISVKDKLPVYNGFYLVAYTSSLQHVTRAYFEDNIFFHICSRNEFQSATHWMHIPKPPKNE